MPKDSPDIPIGSVGDGLGLSVPIDGAVNVNEREDGLQQDQDRAVHDDAHVDRDSQTCEYPRA